MGKSLRFLKGQITRAEAKAKKAASFNIYSLKHFLDELEKDFAELSAFYDGRELSEGEEAEFIEYSEKFEFSLSSFKAEVDVKLKRDPSDSFEQPKTNHFLESLAEKQGELCEIVAMLTRNLPSGHDTSLPTLRIPQFSGDYRQWNSFKGLFMKRIGCNQKLTNVEKLGHLLTLLSGEAAGLVKHLQLEDRNFQPAWEALVMKYDKPFKIGTDIIHHFVKSMQSEIKINAVSEFSSVFAETFLALDNLSEYSKSRDIWVLYFVLDKFDKPLKDRWYSYISGNSEPNINDLLEFLNEQSEICMIKDGRISERKDGFDKSRKAPAWIKSASTFVGSCFVCGSNHGIFSCNKFQAMSVQDREKLVKSTDRCFNCLGSGHAVKKCNSSRSCNVCSHKHHTLLHIDTRRKSSYNNNGNNNNSNDNDGKNNKSDGDVSGAVPGFTAVNCSVGGSRSALLPTALVCVENYNQANWEKCRLMLDSGAQGSFVTESLIRRLNIPIKKVKIPVKVMSSQRPVYAKGFVKLVLFSRFNRIKRLSIMAFVMDTLTGPLPDSPINLKCGHDIYEQFELADPEFDVPTPIDLIIGADHFFDILEKEKYYQKLDRLYVVDSVFGWLVAGGSAESTSTSLCSSHCFFESENCDSVINQFWDLENNYNSGEFNEEDVFCEQLYSSTTTRNADGRYSVNLPFKKSQIMCGETYSLALKRYLCLEKKLDHNEDLRSEYHKLIEYFKDKGYLEKVPLDQIKTKVSESFYLPHYAVVSRSVGEPLKVRIVFDASMLSQNGVSLNDLLLSGPNLQLNILEILTRFSLCKFVFSADITKMYRQIQINECSRDFQRILWRDTQGGDIVHYRLTTVTDGMSCSPYLALRTLNQLIQDEGGRFPLGAEALMDRYMDDFLVGDNDLNRLKEKRFQLISILDSAGMSLSKWASNVPELCESIERKNQVSFHGLPIVKTLGILWNMSDDCFGFNVTPYEGDKFTKRSLLSESARIFDPAGWISPVSVMIKCIFQTTWIRNIGWDDPQPNDLKIKWSKIRDGLPLLSQIKLSRWMGEGELIYLHGFCDASLQAYGAVVYSKVISSDGVVTVRLLCSKSRVAPIKPMSIARLELCGAFLLAKLIHSITPFFRNSKLKIRCWSDSTTVLSWLNASPNKWVSFVSNRCSSIKELIPNAPWYYINTKKNIADIISRGMYPSQLVSLDSWWRGPPWLLDFEESVSLSCPDLCTEEEQKREIKAHLVVQVSFIESLVNRFSSLNRLRRTFAFILRAIALPANRFHGELKSSEIDFAFVRLLRMVQHHYFFDEISCLTLGNPVSRSSSVVRLNPFLDKSGLLRVGGRLENFNLSFDRKHPIILNKGHLVDLILEFLHLKYYHCHVGLLTSMFRSRFFVFGLRSSVKECIHRCQICLLREDNGYQPIMGQLPFCRSPEGRPFYHCGVDFAGPLQARPFRGRGKITIKTYVCVFVCLESKAIHLELVHGLDTGSLVLALKRFASRRGHCSVMFSDNGTNFVGYARILTKLKQQILQMKEDKEVRDYLTNNLMEWRFNPPRSPNFGGIWEACVKSVKYHLYRILVDRIPTVEELTTFLCEIECILNSRPLLPMSEDPKDLSFLSPSHLIMGRSLSETPLLECSEEASNSKGLIHRYHSLRKGLSVFWRSWRNEFFSQNLKMAKWYQNGLGPKVGDLVLIKRRDDPISLWPRGRIVKLIEGADNISRVVELLTRKGVIKEMVRNLVPIVLNPEDSTGGVCSES